MRVLGAALMAGVLSIGCAQAQAIIRTVPHSVVVASDLGGPYDDDGAIPPPAYSPRAYGPPVYDPPGYGFAVLPIHEIYRIVRDGGYSPLGGPRRRGPVYTISVLDPDGEDGRLVIDARSGRIIRFVPAYRYGARGIEDFAVAYGPPSTLPPLPRPPVGLAQPRASVPLPKPRTAAAPPLSERSATVGAVRAPTVPPAPAAALAAAPPMPAPSNTTKPAVTLQPTQAMPPAQGME